MEEWKEYKLEEVCSRLRSGKGIKSDCISNIGLFPVIGGNGMRGYTNKSNFKGECAVIGRQGANCGNVRFFIGEAYMTEHAVVAVGNELADSYFLARLLSLMHLGNLSAQSAQPGLSIQTLSKQIIRLPSISYQREISTVLKSLDNKIELNRHINDNLEQQAQALFNEMFPHITEGENMIGDLIMPKRGKGLLSKNAIKGDIPVVAGGIEPATYHNQANTTAPVLTIAASGANAGYINLWHIPVWASDSSYIDDSITPNVYFWYIMLKKRQKEIFDAQVGSAQPHIYPKHIAELPMNVVFVEKIAEYNEIVTPIFEKKGQLFLESKRLTSLRDTLLPKLMSGELKINDINN